MQANFGVKTNVIRECFGKTDATLTVSVSGDTLTLRNNNYDNDQVVTTVIMGG